MGGYCAPGAELRHPRQNTHTHLYPAQGNPQSCLYPSCLAGPIPTPPVEGPADYTVSIFICSTNCIMFPFPVSKKLRNGRKGIWFSPGTLAFWLRKDPCSFHSRPSPEIGEGAPEVLILAYCFPLGSSFPSANSPWVPPVSGPEKTEC